MLTGCLQIRIGVSVRIGLSQCHLLHGGAVRKMVVNPHADKSHRQPNMVQTAFSEFFNDINAVRDNITKQGHRVQVLNKLLLRKLNL